MAKLLFKLAQVPEDEAAEIRALLNQAEIAFYETDAGFFRVGLDAIWLSDDSEEARARDLLNDYQQERCARQQENYARLVEAGQAPGFWQLLATQPLRVVALIVAMVFVASLTLLPFVMLLKDA